MNLQNSLIFTCSLYASYKRQQCGRSIGLSAGQILRLDGETNLRKTAGKSYLREAENRSKWRAFGQAHAQQMTAN